GGEREREREREQIGIQKHWEHRTGNQPRGRIEQEITARISHLGMSHSVISRESSLTGFHPPFSFSSAFCGESPADLRFPCSFSCKISWFKSFSMLVGGVTVCSHRTNCKVESETRRQRKRGKKERHRERTKSTIPRAAHTFERSSGQ